jgi:phycobilisome core linker protein
MPSTPVMAYDMDGSGEGNLGPRRIKSSSVEKDSRAFKVTYVQASTSRGYTFRELQNVYTVKTVPFSSWYAEQQRIMKMGGKIMKVELISGSKQRSVCTATELPLFVFLLSCGGVPSCKFSNLSIKHS